MSTAGRLLPQTEKRYQTLLKLLFSKSVEPEKLYKYDGLILWKRHKLSSYSLSANPGKVEEREEALGELLSVLKVHLKLFKSSFICLPISLGFFLLAENMISVLLQV